jgi:hypothetical protein
VHKHDYFKYLFGDLGYMGEEMFVMQQLGKHEFAPRHDLNVVHAYKIQSASGVGNLSVEAEMEKIHETL